MTWAVPTASGPINASIRIPGSKSETNRALVIAAIADGVSTLRGVLESRDSSLMIGALRALGVRIDVDADALVVTPPKSFVGGATIECGLAGTVMRFVPPLAMLADAPVRFVGDAHASKRPMAALLDAMRQLGAVVDADALPFTLTPPSSIGASVTIDASSSSQFISGPLLAGARFAHGIEISASGAIPSRPHIDMTVAFLRECGVDVSVGEHSWSVKPSRVRPLDVTLAPDLTNAAAFLAAGLVTGGRVEIEAWPTQTTQPGALFIDIAKRFGATVGAGVVEGPACLVAPGTIDLGDASELTPVVAACAALAPGETRITGVAHIRGHETNRIAALATELSASGAVVEETADGLRIEGGRPLRARTFATYADHRMAHAGAIIGLALAGSSLDDVTCTSKTMPTFPSMWSDLCAG